MPVTLTKIICDHCGTLVGYTVRGGVNHFSADNRDPYSWAATALIFGNRAYIVGMCGNATISEIRETLKLGSDLGYKVEWSRSNGKQINKE